MKTIVKVTAVLLSFICMSILGMDNNKKRKISTIITQQQSQKKNVQYSYLVSQRNEAQKQLGILQFLVPAFIEKPTQEELAQAQLFIFKNTILSPKLVQDAETLYNTQQQKGPEYRLPGEIALELVQNTLADVQKQLQEMDEAVEDCNDEKDSMEE